MLVLLQVVQLRKAKRHDPGALGHMGQQTQSAPYRTRAGFDFVQAVCHDSQTV
jgi:hypothetical protein